MFGDSFAGGRCGGQTLRGAFEHLFAAMGQVAGHGPDVAQRQIRLSRRDEPRILPNDEIVLFPSPASPATRNSETTLPSVDAGSLNRNSCFAASGLTGSIQAFGPPTLPMCPTLLNFHSACCQRAMSAAIAAASPGLAARNRARTGVKSSEGDELDSVSHNVRMYLGLNWRSSRDGLGGFPARGERFAFGQQCGQVFFKRQPAALVGVPDQPLQVDAHRAGCIGERLIQIADLRHDLVGPVAAQSFSWRIESRPATGSRGRRSP